MIKKITILMAAFVLLMGCSGGEEEETVRISDIQKKQGIPVEVEEVSQRKLVISKTYSGTLRGKEEAMVSAPIGGNIEKIFVRIGEYVKKDQIIAQYREDAAASQYRQAKAAFENSVENLKRLEALFEAGAISRQSLDNARTGHEVTKANFEAAQKQIFVIAPISGYVGDIFINEGDGVGSRDPIATITDLRDLMIGIDIPQSDIGHITEETSVKIHPTNDYDGVFKGKVSRISLSASPMTRNFQVDIEIDNPQKILRSGIIAEVELDLVEKDNAIYVLRENIVTQDDKEFVYVVQKGNVVIKEIETGQRSGLVVEILSGLNPGDMLVTSGQSLLTEGAKVNIVNPDKTTEEAAKDE